MKKIFKLKGFTLVEMMIALAVTVLLCGAVMAMFGSVRGIVGDLSDDADVNVTTDTISTYLFNRMKFCSTYNIDVYPVGADGNLNLDVNDITSSSYRANAHLDDIVGNPNAKQTLYAIIILNKGKGSRIYDLGVISSVEEYESKVENIDDWALFSEYYYDDINFKYTFKTFNEDGKTWCKIGVTPYDQNGEPIIESRYQMFNVINTLYNENVVTHQFLPQSSPQLEENPTDSNIVIFYRIRDFSYR